MAQTKKPHSRFPTQAQRASQRESHASEFAELRALHLARGIEDFTPAELAELTAKVRRWKRTGVGSARPYVAAGVGDLYS